MSKGGKKRNDKKPGRNCKSWHSARNFAKMSSGQVGSSSGNWISASSSKTDQNREFFESKLPAVCSEHSVRNKRARDKRGGVTGRRPAGMSLEDWAKQIAGGGRRRPQQAQPEAAE